MYMCLWVSVCNNSVKVYGAKMKLVGNVKKHLNLQIDCGIIELFESLIDDPQVNFKNRKRIKFLKRVMAN